MIMSIVEKIRQLLGSDKSQKRKASDEERNDPLKRFREASANEPIGISKFRVAIEPYPYTRYEQLNRGHRYSDFVSVPQSSMRNTNRSRIGSTSQTNAYNYYDATPSHSAHQSWNKHYEYTNNGGPNLMEELIESDHRYQTQRPQVPPLQPIHRPATNRVSHRQVPSLIKASMSNRQPNGAMSAFNTRPKLNNVPELHPIKRSVHLTNGGNSHIHETPNTSYSQMNHLNDRKQQPAFRDFAAATNYFANTNSLSLKQNVNWHLKENGLDGQIGPPEKKFYSHLMKLIPFYNKSANSKATGDRDTIPKPQEIIDLANEIEDFTESPNVSHVEPVNTLLTRMETKPVFLDGWLSEKKKEYHDKLQNHSQLLKAEKEKTSAAERKTRELESSFLDRMKSLDIDVIYDLSEDEEEDFNDFPALSDEHIHKINQWMSGRDTGTILNQKFSLSITRHDIQTLSWEPLAWLNDEVINFYMELLAERSRLNDALPKVHGMNTFFLKRLLENGYGGVRRWTRKVDIFAHDVIPVPVHKGIHWCMAIIHMKNKTIKYYDSMGAPNNSVLNALAEYLQAECLDKKKCALDMSGWTMENVPNIPQQENGSDCGVFSCMYAEFVSRNRPIVFTQQHMQYFRKRMVYEICTGKMLT